MQKRGQVAIFVIVAIVIVAVVIYLVFFNADVREKLGIGMASKVSMKAEQVNSFATKCLEDTAKSALNETFLRGGYYQKPIYYINTSEDFISYYYYEGKSFMPDKSIIERQLAQHINDNLDLCLNKSEEKINHGKIITEAKISAKKVSFTSDVNIIVEQENSTAKIDKLSVEFNSPLSDMLDVASFFVSSQKENPDKLCITCLDEAAKQKNLFIGITDFSDSDRLVIISTNQTGLFPTKFQFVNKYK